MGEGRDAPVHGNPDLRFPAGKPDPGPPVGRLRRRLPVSLARPAPREEGRRHPRPHRDPPARRGGPGRIPTAVGKSLSPAARPEAQVFSAKDRESLRVEGIPEERALAQLELFQKPPVYSRLDRACTVNDGIARLSQAERDALSAAWLPAAAAGRGLQFTPASGAASRMFKGLLAVLGRPEADSLPRPRQGSGKRQRRRQRDGGLVERPARLRLPRRPGARPVGTGPGPGSPDRAPGTTGPSCRPCCSPTGSATPTNPRPSSPSTAGPAVRAPPWRSSSPKPWASSATATAGCASTSPSRRTTSGWRNRCSTACAAALERDGTRLEIDISQQKPSTNTLAADGDNRPFRNADDSLVFRPGGHGDPAGEPPPHRRRPRLHP